MRRDRATTFACASGWVGARAGVGSTRLEKAGRGERTRSEWSNRDQRHGRVDGWDILPVK